MDGRAPGDIVTASFAMVVPGEPLPVRLMNTVWADRNGVHDVLTTLQNLHAWLIAAVPGFPADRHQGRDPEDLTAFRALRDALRRLAALLTDDTRPAAMSATADVSQAITDINLAVARAPAVPRLEYRDSRLHRGSTGPATATLRALSAIADDAIEHTDRSGPVQTSLRACYAPGCVLFFVKDHPRRQWEFSEGWPLAASPQATATTGSRSHRADTGFA